MIRLYYTFLYYAFNTTIIGYYLGMSLDIAIKTNNKNSNKNAWPEFVKLTYMRLLNKYSKFFNN